MLLSVERFVIYFIAAVLCLSQLGIDTRAILAGAGVLGIAVGFGAQNLVKDMISGFFLILDGNVSTGDSVTVAGQSGTIEGIGLRNTQVRESNGKLWSIPNGDIRILANWSVDWARASVTVTVPYEADLERAIATLTRVGADWSAEHEAEALETPVVSAITELGPAGLGLSITVKVRHGARSGAENDLRRRIKVAFDAAEILKGHPR
jgi:small conductance mechanosensitive channel